MRKEYRQRIANEFRYAATKMKEVAPPQKKLFYFSVIFGEVQRVLNWEWDRDLALISLVTQHTHTQLTAQGALIGAVLPIEWPTIYGKLTEVASDLATYFEKEKPGSRAELCEILGRLAEVGYATSGNGSYLYERGILKL